MIAIMTSNDAMWQGRFCFKRLFSRLAKIQSTASSSPSASKWCKITGASSTLLDIITRKFSF